jgi:hypothetical protein
LPALVHWHPSGSLIDSVKPASIEAHKLATCSHPHLPSSSRRSFHDTSIAIRSPIDCANDPWPLLSQSRLAGAVEIALLTWGNPMFNILPVVEAADFRESRPSYYARGGFFFLPAAKCPCEGSGIGKIIKVEDCACSVSAIHFPSTNLNRQKRQKQMESQI